MRIIPLSEQRTKHEALKVYTVMIKTKTELYRSCVIPTLRRAQNDNRNCKSRGKMDEGGRGWGVAEFLGRMTGEDPF